ncbi:MAG: hypothetical protein MJ177_06705 [Clostridia bacterium]|nr:hypothetical protein [Clostridia bacterium]
METGDLPAWRKGLYILLGAVTMGVMWRTRGEHGWGSSWGVMAAGLVYTLFVYFIFQRKNNASFFHIGVAAVSMMLTTPAWGPLLNQICGRIEATVTQDTLPCTPLSGIFMMLCLGFATPAFFAFFISRLFSEKQYKWYHYLIVIAVPLAVYYISEATISHLIVGLVQPETKKAVADFINGSTDLSGTPYSLYMRHFNNIAWAKKHLAYGRTYFTEIATVSRAIAALAAYITVRFGLKDKTGGRITVFGCAAMAVSITVPDLFFLFKEKYPDIAWLSSAWSFWEYFTGFLFGGIFTAVLLAFSRMADGGIHEKHLAAIPRVPRELFHAAFTFGFCLCLPVFRPIAERFDASDKMKILTYIIGLGVSLVFAGLMLAGKMKKLWRQNAVKLSRTAFPLYFGIQAFIYLFSGDSECIRNIYERGPVLYLMLISYAAFYALYYSVTFKNKKECFV